MITPMTSIQIPRRIAQMTKLMVSPLILSLETAAIFWATWHAVYRLNSQAGAAFAPVRWNDGLEGAVTTENER